MQAMMKNMMDDWMKHFDGIKAFDFPKQMDFMKDLNMSKIGRQALDFNKLTFDNTLEMLSKIQAQTEKMTDSFMKDHAAMPPEGLKMLDSWRDTAKKGQDEFKKAIDEGFNQTEKLLANFGQFTAQKEKEVKAQ